MSAGSIPFCLEFSQHATANNAPANRMIHHQKKNGSRHSDREAVGTQTGYASGAEQLEDPTTNHSAHDAKQNIENHTLASVVHQVTGDETSEQSETNPSKE